MDLILHAEHKGFLDDMRTYHSLMQAEDKESSGSLQKSKELPRDENVFDADVKMKGASRKIENFYKHFNFRSLFGSSSDNRGTKSEKASRFASRKPNRI